EFPEWREFFRNGNADMRIRPPAFDRAHRRHAHDCVTQPITAPDQYPKWLEAGVFREKDAALIFPEQKVWPRRFPPIMYPEPILGRASHLPFQNFIAARSKWFNRFAYTFDWRFGDGAPTCEAVGVNSECNEFGVRPPGQQGRQRCGGG